MDQTATETAKIVINNTAKYNTIQKAFTGINGFEQG